MNTAQTPAALINAVVRTLAGIAGIYVLTMAACVLCGITISETLAAHFANIGNTSIGALIGLLAKTESHPATPPAASTETVTSVTETIKTPAETL